VTPEAQLELVRRCPKCGGAVPALAALAVVLERLGGQAAAADHALGAMRLALPSVLTAAVHELARDLPGVGRAVACAAGVCVPDRRTSA
jgi:hypothetical protein